jgi:hypothetical protein
LEKVVSHFSPEWDTQPAFKFNMDLDVLLIYRLINITHGLFGFFYGMFFLPMARFKTIKI